MSDLEDVIKGYYAPKADPEPEPIGGVSIRKAGDGWAVVDKSTGAVRGTHSSRWEAVKQSHKLG